jgi:hypothetical protein
LEKITQLQIVLNEQAIINETEKLHNEAVKKSLLNDLENLAKAQQDLANSQKDLADVLQKMKLPTEGGFVRRPSATIDRSQDLCLLRVKYWKVLYQSYNINKT